MSDTRKGFGGGGYQGGDGVTRPMVDPEPQRPAPEARADRNNADPRTVVVGGQRTPDMAPAYDPMRDPVVGWLVVVSGVGKGTHRPLGYGQNTVGRGEDARVKLIYGAGFRQQEGATQQALPSFESHVDNTVSRKHFLITYDERGRRFFIEKSQDGTNMTYIKENGTETPVFAARELKAFERILAGNTELMFVPLCRPGDGDNPGFDWKDT
jgi:hypothetical protein